MNLSHPNILTAPLQPAAFIDRDGVINRELHHVHRIEDFHVLPGVVSAMQTLASLGFKLVVVTNQSGIAKGLFTHQDYETLTKHMTDWFERRGVRLAGVYHCPHHPKGNLALWSKVCACRKPEPGMLKQAACELGLDLPRSVMIGDKLTDVQAGLRAGVGKLLLVESGHELPIDTRGFAHRRCANLEEAAKWLMNDLKKEAIDSSGSFDLTAFENNPTLI